MPSDRAEPLGGGKLAGATGWSRYELILSIYLTLLIVHSFYVLVIGLSQPLADLHEFRQTQTALTAYWLWRGGPWLHYETPVLGAPWSIPLEFPLYQGLVAILRWCGLPIDIGGRLVSYVFYIGSLGALGVLFRSLNLGRIPFFYCAVLFMSSPIYLFWSRTVMIEFCAIFFSLAWLAWLSRFTVRQQMSDFVLATMAGIAALITKGTAFAGFGLLGGLLFLQNAHRFRLMGMNKARLTILALMMTAAVLPIMCGVAWTVYATDIAIQNPFFAILIKSIGPWTFGTWSQRVSGQLWNDAFLHRMLSDILGIAIFPGIAMIFIAFLSRRTAWLGGAAITAFLAHILIFTNLNLVHNYYQMENALFLLAAVGFGIFAIFEPGRKWLALAVLVVVSAGQLAFFHVAYATIVSRDYSHTPSLEIASVIRQNSLPGESILVLGQDWSSALPYYSERKALVLPFWTPLILLDDVIAHPQKYLGDSRLGAIVFCPDQLADYPAGAAAKDPGCPARTSGRGPSRGM